MSEVNRAHGTETDLRRAVAPVDERRAVPAGLNEWGPDCVRCGNVEYRIDGYCSCECRDVDEIERELAQLEAENTTLRERGDALAKAATDVPAHTFPRLHTQLAAWRKATGEDRDG